MADKGYHWGEGIMDEDRHCCENQIQIIRAIFNMTFTYNNM